MQCPSRRLCSFFVTLLLLISGAFVASGKNVASPREVLRSARAINTGNNVFYGNETTSAQDNRQTNLILHVLKEAGIVGGPIQLTPGAECARTCNNNERPRICYFEFIMEHYHTMGPACKRCSQGEAADCFAKNCITADSVERGVLSINRQIPGPPVHVCQNDVVIVDVVNEMSGTSTTIHWHGVLQYHTPYMDGVPMLTQCPIQSPGVFRYAFVARESGTKFYHSHSGHHKIDGIYGAFIVREPNKTDLISKQYECDLKEHVILVSDWLHVLADMYVPGLQSTGSLPNSLLVNGRGQYIDSATKVPLTIYRINGCRSCRFRLINSCNGVCAIQLQIENHTLTVIATDSTKVQPVKVDTVYSLAGERYDFVVNANQPPGNYWIRIKAIGVCEGRVAEQFAILSYYSEKEVSDYELALQTRSFPSLREPYPIGIPLNMPNQPCGQPVGFCVSDLVDAEPKSALKMNMMTSKPDYQFVLRFNNYAVDAAEIYPKLFYHYFTNLGAGRSTVVGAINDITFTFPSFPPLTQPDFINENADGIGEQTWCTEGNLPEKCDGLKECTCPYRLKVKKDKIVEVILFDDTIQQSRLTHPFHLHGHDFCVLDMAPLPLGQIWTADSIKDVVRNNKFDQVFGQQRKLNQTFLDAPFKDTVQIPSSGVTRLRFISSNPGYWLMHCHIDWHLAIGMAFVFQVGERAEMSPTPDYFPTCNDYLPDIDLTVT